MPYCTLAIGPFGDARIGIATAYGRPYYRFSRLLRIIGARYDSILPEEIESYAGSLVLTTRKEAPPGSTKSMLFEEALALQPAVLQGRILEKIERGTGGKLVLGVDPGSSSGLSVHYFGREIESSLHPSVEELISRMIMIMTGLQAERRIVKIGNGNMSMVREIGTKLKAKFPLFELELVDERSTSPKIKNFNQRGKRDRLSARYITQREAYGHYRPGSQVAQLLPTSGQA